MNASRKWAACWLGAAASAAATLARTTSSVIAAYRGAYFGLGLVVGTLAEPMRSQRGSAASPACGGSTIIAVCSIC